MSNEEEHCLTKYIIVDNVSYEFHINGPVLGWCIQCKQRPVTQRQ